jgi:hypothetical protein
MCVVATLLVGHGLLTARARAAHEGGHAAARGLHHSIVRVRVPHRLRRHGDAVPLYALQYIRARSALFLVENNAERNTGGFTV